MDAHPESRPFCETPVGHPSQLPGTKRATDWCLRRPRRPASAEFSTTRSRIPAPTRQLTPGRLHFSRANGFACPRKHALGLRGGSSDSLAFASLHVLRLRASFTFVWIIISANSEVNYILIWMKPKPERSFVIIVKRIILYKMIPLPRMLRSNLLQSLGYRTIHSKFLG